MEDSKYYIPKIEEFHVGFEYETFQEADGHNGILSFMPMQDEDEWWKFKFPDPFVGYHLDKLFKACKLRVKYLDKEDIESFDFNYINVTGSFDSSDDHEEAVFVLKRKENTLKHVLQSRTIVRCYSNNIIGIQVRYYFKVGGATCKYGIWRYGSSEDVFKGVIKNKSEFKKILQQVGIIQ